MMTPNPCIWVDFHGDSMHSSLQEGDALYICLAPVEPKIGHIIFYRDQHQFITHRLIEKQGDMLVLKGDRGPLRETIHRRDMLGIVLGKKSRSRYSFWPSGLHPFARSIALASSQIQPNQPRILRWPFYLWVQFLAHIGRFYQSLHFPQGPQ